MNIICKNEDETIKAAQGLAKGLKPQDIILLSGTLGAGKTVFARALIRELCEQPNLEVISPTFTLVQTYDAPPESKITQIHHYDFYRLEDPDEIFELGWEDSLADGITIAEWPERLGPYKPASYLDISILTRENQSDQREIQIRQAG